MLKSPFLWSKVRHQHSSTCKDFLECVPLTNYISLENCVVSLFPKELHFSYFRTAFWKFQYIYFFEIEKTKKYIYEKFNRISYSKNMANFAQGQKTSYLSIRRWERECSFFLEPVCRFPTEFSPLTFSSIGSSLETK